MNTAAAFDKPKPVEPAAARDTVTVNRTLFEGLLEVIIWRCSGRLYNEDDERRDMLTLVRELRAQLAQLKELTP
jgi:hypothetical protein